MADLFDMLEPVAPAAPAGGWVYRSNDAAMPPWLANAAKADRIRFLYGLMDQPFAVIFGEDGNLVVRPGQTITPAQVGAPQ